MLWKPFSSIICSFLIALMLLLITVAALVPNLFPLPTYYADKMLHINVCTLALVAIHLRFRSRKLLILACVGLLTAGIGLEILQGMIPGREVSLDDMLANLTGTGLGALIATLLVRGLQAGQQQYLSPDRHIPQKYARLRNRKTRIPG